MTQTARNATDEKRGSKRSPGRKAYLEAYKAEKTRLWKSGTYYTPDVLRKKAAVAGAAAQAAVEKETCK